MFGLLQNLAKMASLPNPPIFAIIRQRYGFTTFYRPTPNYGYDVFFSVQYDVLTNSKVSTYPPAPWLPFPLLLCRVTLLSIDVCVLIG